MCNINRITFVLTILKLQEVMWVITADYNSYCLKVQTILL